MPARPGYIAAMVANACATIAGWYRMIGAVTPVMKGTFFVAWSAELITVHAKLQSVPPGMAIR